MKTPGVSTHSLGGKETEESLRLEDWRTFDIDKLREVGGGINKPCDESLLRSITFPASPAFHYGQLQASKNYYYVVVRGIKKA